MSDFSGFTFVDNNDSATSTDNNNNNNNNQQTQISTISSSSPNSPQKYSYLDQIDGIDEDCRALLRKNKATLDFLLDEETTKQDFIDMNIAVADIKKIMKWIEQKKHSLNIDWRTEIQSHTNEFDSYLNISSPTTNLSSSSSSSSSSSNNIPSAIIIRFCQWMKDFVEKKHQQSEIHAAVARDAFLWISKFIRDAASVQKFCACISRVICNNFKINQKLFGSNEGIRQVLCWISVFATSDAAVREWSEANSTLTYNNEANREFLGTAETCRAFSTVSKYIASSSSSNWFCWAVSNVTNVESHRVLFGTEAIRDACVNISRFFDDGIDARAYAKLLNNLTFENESNKKLFAVNSIRDAMLKLTRHVNHCWIVFCWSRTLISLTEKEPTLFCVPETVTGIVCVGYGNNAEHFRQSSESIYFFLCAVKMLLEIDKKLFDCPEIHQVVAKLKERLFNHTSKKTTANNELETLIYAREAWKRVWQRQVVNEEYNAKSIKLVSEIEKIVHKRLSYVEEEGGDGKFLENMIARTASSSSISSPSSYNNDESSTLDKNNNSNISSPTSSSTTTTATSSAEQKQEQDVTAFMQELQNNFHHTQIIHPSDVKLETILSSGGQGTVYAGSVGNRLIAAKMYNSVKEGIDEAKLCCALSHKNIISFVGVSCYYVSNMKLMGNRCRYAAHSKPRLLLLLELGECALSDVLRSDINPDTPFNQIISEVGLALQMASAFNYLHCVTNETKTGVVVHNDVKPANWVCFNEQTVVKLLDFGLAIKSLKESLTSVSLTTAKLGTRCWSSFEQRTEHDRALPSRDVYSYGVILFNFITGLHPGTIINSSDEEQLKNGANLLLKALDEKPSRPGCPEFLKSVCRECMKPVDNLRCKNGGEILKLFVQFREELTPALKRQLDSIVAATSATSTAASAKCSSVLSTSIGSEVSDYTSYTSYS